MTCLYALPGSAHEGAIQAVYNVIYMYVSMLLRSVDVTGGNTRKHDLQASK